MIDNVGLIYEQQTKVNNAILFTKNIYNKKILHFGRNRYLCLIIFKNIAQCSISLYVFF